MTLQKQRILIIEDETSISMAIRDELEFEGFDVIVREDGRTGFSTLLNEEPDLVILDLMLPETSGFEICREVRKKGLKVPIIILTARGEEIDRVRGLDLGADDYVTKPFSLAELVARVRAVLRRSSAPEKSREDPDELRLGELRLDTRKHLLFKGDARIELTHKEFQLLALLLRHRGEVISRDRFLDELWGEDVYVTHRTVDTHMASLRRKIEDIPHRPRYILSIRGAGYRLNEDLGWLP